VYGTQSAVIKFKADEAVNVLRGMIRRAGKDVEFIVKVYLLVVWWMMRLKKREKWGES